VITPRRPGWPHAVVFVDRVRRVNLSIVELPLDTYRARRCNVLPPGA
jgi:hypothetical protein